MCPLLECLYKMLCSLFFSSINLHALLILCMKRLLRVVIVREHLQLPSHMTRSCADSGCYLLLHFMFILLWSKQHDCNDFAIWLSCYEAGSTVFPHFCFSSCIFITPTLHTCRIFSCSRNTPFHFQCLLWNYQYAAYNYHLESFFTAIYNECTLLRILISQMMCNSTCSTS